MKLIIAGGRNYQLTPRDIEALDALHAQHHITRVISGGAEGADRGGMAWAKARHIPVDVYPPNWKEFGPSAGPRRNFDMAEVADALAFFPGGKGTHSMVSIAKRRGLTLFDLRSPRNERSGPGTNPAP